MRVFLSLLCCAMFLFTGTQNQSSGPIPISKKAISEARDIKDLIKDLPDQYKSIEMEFMIRVNGNTYELTNLGPVLSKECLTLLKSVDVGSKVYVDIKVQTEYVRALTYALIVTEN